MPDVVILQNTVLQALEYALPDSSALVAMLVHWDITLFLGEITLFTRWGSRGKKLITEGTRNVGNSRNQGYHIT